MPFLFRNGFFIDKYFRHKMKKIIAGLWLACIGFGSIAQTTPIKTTTTTTSKTKTKTETTTVHRKKDGTVDKRYASSRGLKKDGTPDKRFRKKH